MADEAHKEPTMEEILSSIRKIISEDEAPADEPELPSADVADISAAPAVNDDFADIGSDDTDLAFEDEFQEEDIFETESSLDDEDDAFDEEPVFATETALDELEEDDFAAADDFADVDDLVAEPAPAVFAEPEPQPEPVAVAAPTPAPEPAPVVAPPAPEPAPAREEPAMTQTAAIRDTALTDQSTADAAAGALGKLISNMDLGGENTIDALVRELLKPMIKEWLDANLQGIVEAKVEAEVARIARMAR